jgi:threonine/homoserine/homoserine lactone efflux protein
VAIARDGIWLATGAGEWAGALFSLCLGSPIRQILAARPAMARAITCVSGAVMIVIGLLLLAGRLII